MVVNYDDLFLNRRLSYKTTDIDKEAHIFFIDLYYLLLHIICYSSL